MSAKKQPAKKAAKKQPTKSKNPEVVQPATPRPLFEVGKTYKRRDGLTARVICTDVKHKIFPRRTILVLSEHDGTEKTWSLLCDGRWTEGIDSRFDILPESGVSTPIEPQKTAAEVAKLNRKKAEEPAKDPKDLVSDGFVFLGEAGTFKTDGKTHLIRRWCNTGSGGGYWCEVMSKGDHAGGIYCAPVDSELAILNGLSPEKLEEPTKPAAPVVSSSVIKNAEMGILQRVKNCETYDIGIGQLPEWIAQARDVIKQYDEIQSLK